MVWLCGTEHPPRGPQILTFWDSAPTLKARGPVELGSVGEASGSLAPGPPGGVCAGLGRRSWRRAQHQQDRAAPPRPEEERRSFSNDSFLRKNSVTAGCKAWAVGSEC